MSKISEFPLPMDCSPLIRELFNYWISIHSSEALPGRRQFEPLDVFHLSENIWMVNVERDPLRYKIRRFGAALSAFTGRDDTGRYLDESLPNFQQSDSREILAGVVANGRPAFRRDRAVSAPHKSHVFAERIILPLAADGATVDVLLNMTCYLIKNESPMLEPVLLV
jgi:hypothetical protein